MTEVRGPYADTADLLATAREALMAEVAPSVPAEQRYSLLMVANALGIASRELATGDTPPTEALERLRALYEEPADASRRPLHERVEALERLLTADIRHGAYDSGPRREQARAHLEATARADTLVANPRYLEA